MKLNLIVFLLSILTFGQTKISWFNIEYSSFKLFSNTNISIESPESDFYGGDKIKNKDKAFVTVKKNLKSNRNYEKKMYLSLDDYKEIEDKLLELNSSDIFRKNICLDGYRLTVTMEGYNSSQTTFNITCTQSEDTNIHKAVNFILDKLKIKKEDFYK